MPERDGYIPGVPCWVDTGQPDPEASLPFYAGVFGWEFEDVMPSGSEGHYFIGRIRGGDVGAVGTSTGDVPGAPSWNTYIWVSSVDEAATAARNAGGTVAVEPVDVSDSGRMAVLVDPEGATFSVWEPNKHKGSGIVNEHGSVNFNTLATRDPEAAETFYGAVFGWQILSLPPSGSMWALPAYGDHLEAATPGLRKQQAAMGAPDGFIDVVAALESIAEGDAETPAHWSVTFAVDDADAAAAKALELGGKVVSPPVDAPWSRMAVIQDPQGATFVASQFVPENRDLTA